MSSSTPDQPLDAPTGPGGPQDPDALQPGSQSSTAVLERPELSDTDGDDERFAHYVRKDKIASSAVSGRPVVALCGKVWTPGRDPEKYPVCPQCKAIYEEMMNAGSGRGSGKGSGNGRRGWPFGRGRSGSGE